MRGYGIHPKKQVALITLERWDSKRYPDDLIHVILQYKQFSWTNDYRRDSRFKPNRNVQDNFDLAMDPLRGIRMDQLEKHSDFMITRAREWIEAAYVSLLYLNLPEDEREKESQRLIGNAVCYHNLYEKNVTKWPQWARTQQRWSHTMERVTGVPLRQIPSTKEMHIYARTWKK